jgi:tetratricopeptide (TPR) repeat protein
VDRSLVVAEPADGDTRYRLLEILREYAAQTLAPEELEGLRQRHALFFLSFAEASKAPWHGTERGPEPAWLQYEQQNLRAALAWSLGDTGDVEIGLRLTSRLSALWARHITEGRDVLAKVLERSRRASPKLRAEALYVAAGFAGHQQDLVAARAAFEECLALRRACGDRAGVADVLIELGLAVMAGPDPAAAHSLLAESLTIRQELGDRAGVACVLQSLASLAERGGDPARARAHLEESVAIGRECGCWEIVAYSLQGLGWLSARQGELAEARALMEESVEAAREAVRQPRDITMASAIQRGWEGMDLETARFMLEQCLLFSRTLGHTWSAIHDLGSLGHLARRQGDYEGCAAYYRESLMMRRERDDRFAIAQSLEDLAGLAGRQERHERSARLLGAAEALCEKLGKSLPVAVPDEYETATRRARAALGEEAYLAAWAAGRAMSMDDAVAYALEGG